MSGAGKGLTSWFADARRCKPSVVAVALGGVLALTACGTRPAMPTGPVKSTTSASPSLPVTPAPAPSLPPTPTPFPKASPVDSVAGWQTLASTHWTGYTFPVRGVTGVRAQWSEPTVSGPSHAEEFIWLGIGGWDETLQNIIQIGTFAYFPGAGDIHQGIWYQLVPTHQHARFPRVDVSPGDEIAASIVLKPRQQRWRMSLTDVSNGTTFAKTVHFDSLGAYPAFIVEDPNKGPLGPSGPFYVFPHWGKVTFRDMQIRIAGSWKPAASIYGHRIQMIRNEHILATAGPLNKRSGFSAKQSSP
jgi:Peptidase A4 family